MTRRWPLAAAIGVLVLTLKISGCTTPGTNPTPPPGGLSELLERSAERALFDAMRAYDDGQYGAAELALRKALSEGLRSARDRATAHKLLAFISCTSERLVQCEAAFRAARAADTSFTLSRPEVGHPIWGPVYRRVLVPVPAP